MRRGLLGVAALATLIAAAALPAQTPPPTTDAPPPPTSTRYNHLALRPLAIGDSITPRYSITTDSILAVKGYNVIAKSCGVGHFFFRAWNIDSVTKLPTVVHADTIAFPTVSATCVGQWSAAGGDTTVASTAEPYNFGVCLPPGSYVLTPFYVRVPTPGGSRDSLVRTDTARTIPACR